MNTEDRKGSAAERVRPGTYRPSVCTECGAFGFHPVLSEQYLMDEYQKRRRRDLRYTCVYRKYVRLVTVRKCRCRRCGAVFRWGVEGFGYRTHWLLAYRKHKRDLALCERYPYEGEEPEDGQNAP